MSQSEYKLLIFSSSGTRVAEITDFTALGMTKSVNQPGALTLDLPASHPVLPLLQPDSILELWRRNQAYDVPWTLEFQGIYRADERRWFDEYDRFRATCPGVLSLLGRRVIAWRAETTNRSTFNNVAAETVMKTLVRYNAGADATTGNGRLRTASSLNISVEADQGRGPSITWSGAYKNLLTALQELATIASMDFDLIRVGSGWEFRVYPGQRGVDRRAQLVFALEYGNIDRPELRIERMRERTVAIVGGQGQGSQRAFAVQVGPTYSASNDVELFVDGRQNSSPQALSTEALIALQEQAERQSIRATIIQTPGTAYGKHYGVGGVLGDLVRLRYAGYQQDHKIVTVTITLDEDGEERIEIETEAL